MLAQPTTRQQISILTCTAAIFYITSKTSSQATQRVHRLFQVLLTDISYYKEEYSMLKTFHLQGQALTLSTEDKKEQTADNSQELIGTKIHKVTLNRISKILIPENYTQQPKDHTAINSTLTTTRPNLIYLTNSSSHHNRARKITDVTTLQTIAR